MSRSDTNKIREYFDTHTDQFQYQDARTDISLQQREELIVRELKRLLPSGSTLFEIGCGTGKLLLRLHREGYRVTACDISSQMVEQTRARLRDGGAPEVTVAVSNFLEAPPITRFDAVIANGVIMYYEDHHAFLSTVSSILNPGGLAIVSHRNPLFNLFALNHGTVDFFQEHLLTHLDAATRQDVIDRLVKTNPGLSSAVQPSSNQVLFRSAENPLTCHNLYSESGLDLDELRYTSIQPAPPSAPVRWTDAELLTLAERYENRWEGMFIATQFVAFARKRA